MPPRCALQHPLRHGQHVTSARLQVTKICKPATRTKTIDFETMASADMASARSVIIEQHHQLSAKGRCGQRWSQSLITTCLSLWIRSPQAYRDLLGTDLIILPSRSILKLYKSDVQQDAGFHPKIFKWMRLEPLRRNLPPAAYHGGILVDEMSIVHRRRSAGGAVRAVRSGGAVRYAAGWFRRPRSRVSATVDVANRQR